MLKALKVKLKTLASEAKHIRHEERGLMGWRRLLLKKQSFRHNKEEKKPEERKWPSLEEKLKKFHQSIEEASNDAFLRYWNLHHHRVTVLRKTARINHLAYNFLRGVPFKNVEAGAFSFPDLAAIEKVAARFSEVGDNEFKSAWNHWATEAKEHYESKGNLNNSVDVNKVVA